MEYEYKWLYLYVMFLVIPALDITEKSNYMLELRYKYSQFAT